MSRIIAFVNDLFFATKIAETARLNNAEITFVRSEHELLDYLSKETELIIFDLSNKALDLGIVKDIRSNLSLSKVKIIGFIPHVEVELKNKALKIGFDNVYARSEFSKKLAEII
ncbi:hypothetical protein J4458_03470 [Candidatus Woesearchaeota archaeon]|nr:hypothetical protein [Candidatus Woesearchaeota archaeon]